MSTRSIKRIVLIIATGLLGVSWNGFAQPGGGKIYNLKQCIEKGIENNLVVRQSGLSVETSEVGWNQARLNLLPNFNGSVSHGINQGRSIDPFTNSYINQQVNFGNYNINGGVVLFNGLSLQNTIRQNALSYQASKMDLQQAKDNLTIDIILAYLIVLSNEDQLLQAKNQAELTNKQVQRLETLVKEGAIRPSDLSDLKGQYAADELNVFTIQSAMETAKLNLCQLMNILYEKDMRLERLDTELFFTKYPEEAAQIYQKALTDFALVRSAEFRTKSARANVKATRGLLFPTLSFNGSGSSNYSSAATQDVFINTTDEASTDYVVVGGVPSPVIRKQNNFRTEKIVYGKQINNNIFTSFSLNLRIPIFNSWQLRNRVKLARISEKNFTLVEQATKTELQQNIERAYLNMTTAFDRYKILLLQVEAFSESFRAAEIRFNEGVGNSIDYLTAKNNLDRATSNLIISKYDYVLRTKVLDYYQGKAGW
jgi:outer membrane protein